MPRDRAQTPHPPSPPARVADLELGYLDQILAELLALRQGLERARLPVAFAPVVVATADVHTIVSARGQRILVVSYALVADGAVNVTWRSGANALSGPLSLAANGGLAEQGTPETPLLITDNDHGLELELSDAVQVGGRVTYVTAP